MVGMADDHDVACRAHAGVDDRDVHRARRKVLPGTREPESRFGRPVHEDLVSEIDDACGRKTAVHAPFHDADERPPMTEVSRDGDDARCLHARFRRTARLAHHVAEE
jgi:hypothetical protein